MRSRIRPRASGIRGPGSKESSRWPAVHNTRTLSWANDRRSALRRAVLNGTLPESCGASGRVYEEWSAPTACVASEPDGRRQSLARARWRDREWLHYGMRATLLAPGRAPGRSRAEPVCRPRQESDPRCAGRVLPYRQSTAPRPRRLSVPEPSLQPLSAKSQ